MCGKIYDPGMRPYPPRVRRKSTNPSQSAIDQWGWGRHTVRGGIDPRDQLFVPGVLGVVDVYGNIYYPRMGPHLPYVRLVPRTQASQRSSSEVGVSTPCVAVSTRGITVFVPGLFEL